MAADGASDREIAQALFVKQKTVRSSTPIAVQAAEVGNGIAL